MREDDIWIISYPKTGSTWTQELVWMLINDVDAEKAKGPLISRVPFLESYCLFGPEFLQRLGIALNALPSLLTIFEMQALKSTDWRLLLT